MPSTQSYDYVEQTRPRPRPRIGEYVPITTTGYPPRPIDNEEALNYNHNRKMVFNHPDRRYEIQTNSIEQGTEVSLLKCLIFENFIKNIYIHFIIVKDA